MEKEAEQRARRTIRKDPRSKLRGIEPTGNKNTVVGKETQREKVTATAVRHTPWKEGVSVAAVEKCVRIAKPGTVSIPGTLHLIRRM